MSPTAAVRVVVPAHDEAHHLPRLLASLGAAAAHLRDRRPDVEVRVTVVLDACTDGSADVLRRHRWVHAVEADHRCVGAARRTGVAAAPRSYAGAQQTWVACTDADSVVPGDWLSHHVALADGGADLVLGTVRPDTTEQSLLRAWHARHVLGDGHPHVHGANLGVRLSAYTAAGGFTPLATGEDAALTEAVLRDGGRVVRTGRAPVRTSARTRGRAPLGFAAYLLALGLGVDAVG